MTTTTTTTIPVHITDSAQTIIDTSTDQGEAFPEALTETFSAIPGVQSLNITTTQDADHIVINIIHRDEALNDRFFVLASDLLQDGFDASRTAEDLSKLYREFTLKEFNSMQIEQGV